MRVSIQGQNECKTYTKKKHLNISCASIALDCTSHCMLSDAGKPDGRKRHVRVTNAEPLRAVSKGQLSDALPRAACGRSIISPPRVTPISYTPAKQLSTCQSFSVLVEFYCFQLLLKKKKNKTKNDKKRRTKKDYVDGLDLKWRKT